MLLLRNHSLKKFNTFGVDVKAKHFAEVFAEDELREILSDIKFNSERKLILGGGSNILFTKDFDGVIIKVSISGISVIEDEEDSILIEAGAGVIWNVLVKFCVGKNYGGIENLTLIPGTVGAAPIQNIGAYGQEVADTFVSLAGAFVETAEQRTFIKNECKFSYRSSIFKEELKNNFIITSVRLRLSKKPQVNTSYKTLNNYLSEKKIKNPSIREVSTAVETLRRSRLPDPSKIGNAGSFFKNPVVSENYFEQLKRKYSDLASFPSENDQIKISAGWLIEKSGWKGKRIGDVGTSPDHALVICNFGNATGSEILEFAAHIKKAVADKFGINLEEEVNVI